MFILDTDLLSNNIYNSLNLIIKIMVQFERSVIRATMNWVRTSITLRDNMQHENTGEQSIEEDLNKYIRHRQQYMIL